MNHYIKIFTCLVFFTVIINSCCLKKDTGIYRTTIPVGGELELFADSTYNADYKMAGYSNGSWHKKGDTIILNSKYKECCIYGIEVAVSKSDTSRKCIINLRTLNDEPYLEGAIILINENENDSLWVHSGILIVDKSKGYSSFIIAQPLTGKDTPAVSEQFNIQLSDTITIYYDYLQDEKNYYFYHDQKFLLDHKNRTLHLFSK